MHGHPNTMLSDRELFNFSLFLRSNPHLTSPNPQGAYDALPRGMKRKGKSLGKGIPIREFARGGKFDTARYGLVFDEADPERSPKTAQDVEEFLKELASRLSPEGWAALREAICEGSAADEEENPELAERKQASAKDRRAKDSPPEFEGKPTTGVERASDKAFDWLPNTNRITGYVPPRANKRVARTAAQEKSFADRFPDAARLIGGVK